MPITLHIPSPLRPDCGGKSELLIEAATVREALEVIRRDYSRLYTSVCDETGAVRRHVHLFVNDLLVSPSPPGDTKLAQSFQLNSGDVLSIMPAVSGG